ncbi:hypothetical protein ABZ682_10290 [Streptomyces griseoviridis]|uniref:hypothetical protein n=1 Tax=Streptomyces griseoviridis TaxID=45398 RepID=UPI0034025F70
MSAIRFSANRRFYADAVVVGSAAIRSTHARPSAAAAAETAAAFAAGVRRGRRPPA